jgi:pteridine reductase
MTSAKPVALVTGGAKRVGRAIVETLANAGFDIAFTYRSSRDDADDLLATLDARGTRAIAIYADLLDPESSASAIDDAVRKSFAGLKVLVNNASLYEPGDLQATNLSQTRKFNAIHVEAPLMLCQRLEPLLRASKGHVINMVDLLAEKPWPAYLAYCTSKAGLWNLTLGLARALAPDVTVNGIAPGVVEWPSGYPEAEKEKYLNRVPLARPGTADDVAALVRFLVMDGSYVTGQIIKLDGGRSIT